MAISIEKDRFQPKSVDRLTNKFLEDNSTENEKWVYFAVARQWRKIGTGLFRK